MEYETDETLEYVELGPEEMIRIDGLFYQISDDGCLIVAPHERILVKEGTLIRREDVRRSRYFDLNSFAFCP